MRSHIALSLLLLCFVAEGASAQGDVTQPNVATFKSSISTFMKKHCIVCHGRGEQEGDVRLDTINGDLVTGDSVDLWKDVRHRLEAGEMPPKDKPQPTTKERDAVLSWIRRELLKRETARLGVPGRVVLRRLNRDEYRNTVKDLLGLPYDIGSELPPDTTYEGFQNVAAVQELSPEQMETYLRLARFAIETAIVHGDRPFSVHYRLNPEKGKDAAAWRVESYGNPKNEEIWRSFINERNLPKEVGNWTSDHRVVPINHKAGTVNGITIDPSGKGGWLRASDVLNASQFNPWGRLHFSFQMFPRGDGAYRVRVKAGAKRAANLGNPTMGVLAYGKLLTRVPVLADAKNPEWYEFEYTKSDLQTVAFHNRDNRSWRAKGKDLILYNAYEYPGAVGKRTVRRYKLPEGAELPGIYIEEVQISYNEYKEWPPASHNRILFDSPNSSDRDTYVREILTRFMSRAFRRPVRKEELGPKLALFKRKYEQTGDFVLAIREPLVATLVSPQFLFINEDDQHDPQQRRRLNDYELASRLSYFLWQTMPDGRLLELAKNKKLSGYTHQNVEEPRAGNGGYEKLINSMLADSRSKRMSAAFVSQWLELGKLDGIMMEDDRWTYSDTFKDVIRQEPIEFFHRLVGGNLSLLNLIDSDFAMVNERLALHYDIPNVYGSHFRPVSLGPDQPRGGLMTQAACMTVTTDGMITSPIYRGVWILDKILDRKPPEAPANVPPLEDAPTERLSLRDQFAKHREDAGCAACHSKIDPVGWPFERYGLLGDYNKMGWGPNWAKFRDPKANKEGKLPDMHGTLPDGTRVGTVEDIKRVFLANYRRDLLRRLTKNMLIFALGRPLDLSDEETVNGIIQHVESNQHKARELIYAVVRSAPFLEK